MKTTYAFVLWDMLCVAFGMATIGIIVGGCLESNLHPHAQIISVQLFDGAVVSAVKTGDNEYAEVAIQETEGSSTTLGVGSWTPTNP